MERAIYPVRGQIYMADKLGNIYPAAINKKYYLLYSIPKDINDKEGFSSKVAEIINVPKSEILRKVSKENDPYERLKNKLSDDEAKKMKELDIEGVGFQERYSRYYPFGSFGGHVLGFLGYKDDEVGEGFYGLEGYYDAILRGESGYFKGQKDTAGTWIPFNDKEYITPKNGSDLYLTLDYNIQMKAENVLKDLMDKWKPKRASIVVEDPQTGKIKAMATFPNYDPNSYNEVSDYGIYQNPIIQHLFEPGSIFKPITASVALNENKITEKTEFKDTGILKIKGYTITNFHEKVYGIRTMTEVIENSINTGAVFMQQSVDKNVFKDYMYKYGLSTKTGIDLAGEVSGNLLNLNTNRDIEYATAAFGQGISMTSIEIIQAISAMANKGTIMKPYLVEKIVHPDETEEIINPSALVDNVISPKVALAVARMMVSTVQNTYLNNKMGMEGYSIAAKTGTAQIPDPAGGGYLHRSRTIQSLISFFPAFDPKYLVLIKMEEPEGSDAAGNAISLFMKEMNVFLINYSQIPPDNPVKK